MKKLPAREEQVVMTHAAFICQVVEFSRNPARREEFEALLGFAVDNGWNNLVAAIRRIAAGERELGVLNGLDREDRIIAEAIMRGIQNPDTLPDPAARPDPEMAAPGLAGMILAARRGNTEALQADIRDGRADAPCRRADGAAGRRHPPVDQWRTRPAQIVQRHGRKNRTDGDRNT